MEPLEQLRAIIPNFPGYDDEDARRLADEEVRSYLGEALARLTEQFETRESSDGRMDDLLLRTGFTNQAAMKAYEERIRLHGEPGPMPEADFEVVEFAQQAATLTADGLPAYLEQAAEILDRRDAVMSGGTAAVH